MLVAGADGTFSAHRFFQCKHDGNAPEAHQGHIAKIVHVGPEACLGVQILRHEPVGAVERPPTRLHARTSRLACHGSCPAPWFCRDPGSARVRCDAVAGARDNRIHHGNSDAATDIAEQVIEAAGVANLFILEERHGGLDSGTNTQPEPKPLMMIAHKERPLSDREVISPNHKLATANNTKPKTIRYRLSISRSGSQSWAWR